MEQNIEHRICRQFPDISGNDSGQNTEYSSSTGSLQRGSALILVVMLITLLSVIGAMFLLRSRVGRMSSSAIQRDEELNNAVDSVVAAISQQLVLDTPGVRDFEEYYDYPDPCNAWLANLEPYKDGTNYYWRQISDIYGLLIAYDLQPTIVEDRQLTITQGDIADADGDGIADSLWVAIPDVNTSKGEAVYAAIRIVDNGGMLNVNTGYKFAPFGYEVEAGDIDGSSQTQIDFLSLSDRDNTHSDSNKVARLLGFRNWDGTISSYKSGVVWRYDNPASPYTPFDISDELKLRNRYLLSFNKITTRIEELWTYAYDAYSLALEVPVNSDSTNWREAAMLDTSEQSPILRYDFKHISTTYNADTVVNPLGGRMANIRNVPEDDEIDDELWAQDLYSNSGILSCIDTTSPYVKALRAEFAQIIANIKDYSDSDKDGAEVTTVKDLSGNLHYGYELPEIRISELVYGDKYIDPCDPSAVYDINDPNNRNPKYIHRSFAIEISNVFSKDEKFDDWRLTITNPSSGYSPGSSKMLAITSTLFGARGGRYYVAIYQDPCVPLADLVHWSDSPADGATGVDPNVRLCWEGIQGRDANGVWTWANAYDVYFGTDSNGVKKADVNDTTGIYQGRQNTNCFDPLGSGPMQLGTTYYWRIAGVNDFDRDTATINNKKDIIIDSGQPPWSFQTWFTEPNSVIDNTLDANSPAIFGPEGYVILQRRVIDPVTKSESYIIVDMLGYVSGTTDNRKIPFWLFDPNDANRDRRTRSFQRDLSWAGRLKRLWNTQNSGVAPIDIPSSTSPTLGWSNDFRWPYSDKRFNFQVRHSLNNVGELGSVFKKSTYYAPLIGTDTENYNYQLDRIDYNDVEFDDFAAGMRGMKADVIDPNVQRMFKYLTVMDPCSHGKGGGEWRVQGRININTAPWYVLAQLPWVSIHDNPAANYALAKAIIAYRDKLDIDSVVNYSGRSGMYGFENIGQLNNVNKVGTDNFARIDYFALDLDLSGNPKDQLGFPDLSTNRRTKNDGYANDMEERDLIFARISDLVTVRSDVFTAYILVRLGADGPQKRVMAILDRSDVRNIGGKIIGSVKIRSLYPVPDPR